MRNSCQNPFKNLVAKKAAPLILLKDQITNRYIKLQEYAKRPDARQRYVNSENEHLSTLVGIHDELALVRHLDMWLALEQDLIRVNQSDSFVNAYQVNINLTPGYSVPAVLTYNLY